MSLIGALTKAAKAGEAAKKTAPFYSAVDEALANIARPKGTGAEFLTELSKQAGVKKAELADRKLEQAFKAKGKITKEEAQQILKENPPPKLQERILEDLDQDARMNLIDDKMEIYGYRSYDDVPRSRMKQWEDEIDAEAAQYGPETGYSSKGGSNYREILLKLPQAFTDREAKRIMELEANLRRGELPSNQMQELMALKNKQLSAPKDYTSSHWDHDPNVLAHIRVQDKMIPQPAKKGFYVVNKTSGRKSGMYDTPEELQAYVDTLPESIRNNVQMYQGEQSVPSKKVLQIEEIQSDWHQEGRKKGYRADKPPYTVEADQYGVYRIKDANGQTFTPYVDGEQMSGFMTPEAAENAAKANIHRFPEPAGVPNAPFKKNWHELAMKRILNYAADKGYEGIAITPSEQHFKRYGSERIDWKKGDDGWIVGAKEQYGGRHNGQDVEDLARERGILLEKQGDPVKSKEDLERIINVVLSRGHSEEQRNKLTNRLWERMQTEPEGTSMPRKEGMEGFYDKMLTDYLNNYGKDYGAQVQMRQLHATPEAVEKQFNINQNTLPDMTADQASDYSSILQGFGKSRLSDVHYFPITQPMRESIKQKGLPLYQQIGIPTAGAGAASQMPEMDFEPEVKKADGGAINYNTAPDMSDGGRIIQGAPFKHGGKVNITTNRDAMFMELSNKKLKRK